MAGSSVFTTSVNVERVKWSTKISKGKRKENQDGGVGRHTAPPRTTRTDRESNSKGDQHQGNRK